MSVTQRHIAEAAGVSQMTVSNALRGSELVAAETRQRVLQVAGMLGYRPNSSAVAIRKGRFGCVAILESTQPHRSSFFGGTLFEGVQSVLGAKDIHISLVRLSDQSLTDPRKMPKILREYMADGLLINYFAEIPPKLVEMVERYRMPAVWINSKQPHDCVYLDDYRGGREATEYLLDLGHRDIGYADYRNIWPADLSPDKVVHYSIADRQMGYRDAMRDAGLNHRLLHNGKASLSPAQGLEAARALFARPDWPTAIIAAGGDIAMQLIQAATERGLRVGRDLSVIAFEDWTVAASGIRLTQMRHRWTAVGAAASQMLLDRIETPDVDRPPLVLPFERVEGETCGPPPDKSS